MAIDLFDTRTLLPMLEVMKPAKTFLLDTFFRQVEQSTTEFVDLDVMVGKRRLAPFVHPKMKGKQVERIGWKTQSFKPPYIKPKMATTACDLLKRRPGEIIYQNGISMAERAAEQVAKDLATLQEMAIRREEWMASKALIDGQVPIQGDGIDALLDFQMPAEHRSPITDQTGLDAWENSASDPLKNLREYSRLIEKATGLVPDVLILGQDVVDNFLTNTEVRQSLDTRRIEMGQIDPRALPNGASFLGTLKHPALDVYSYNEWYLDGSTLEPMVEPKRIILGSTRARAARHYAAIRDLMVTGAVRWFPKSWEEMDPSVRWIMVQSAPVTALHQANAFVSAQVVT